MNQVVVDATYQIPGEEETWDDAVCEEYGILIITYHILLNQLGAQSKNCKGGQCDDYTKD